MRRAFGCIRRALRLGLLASASLFGLLLPGASHAALAKFRESGFRFRELIVALVTSDLFLQKGSG